MRPAAWWRPDRQPLLESCFNGLEPPLPYPRGQLNSDLQGALEGWLPNGQHEPSAIDLTQEALMGSNQQTLAFLKQLIELIQERVKYTQRHVGPRLAGGPNPARTDRLLP